MSESLRPTGHEDERRRTYLIQDPYDDDAIEYIRTIDLHFGIRPVCLYTDPKARFYGEQQFPDLCSDLIEHSVDISDRPLEDVLRELAQRYDILGVVPFREDKVEAAADICQILDLTWNDPETLRRFRDKHAMKSYLAEHAPEVRVPRNQLLRTSSDLDPADLPAHFVIKPNDGLGNANVGIFTDNELDAARRHMDATPETTWILEEFIGGTEYVVNGQVRADGSIEVITVLEYVRGVFNGYPTVYLAELQVWTDEEPFDQLRDYAITLVTALGLRACPFHLEAKVDERGPCVIDLGARLPSELAGRYMTRMHPYRPSVYLIAAHDYLGQSSLGPQPIRWDRYNERRLIGVYGVSEQEGRITTLDGIADVEAHPYFVKWPVKPTVGGQLDITTDLLSTPWVAEFDCPLSREDTLAFAEEIRTIVRINDAISPASRGEALIADVVPRGLQKGRWLAERARRTVAARLS